MKTNNIIRGLCFTYDNVAAEIEIQTKQLSKTLANIKAKEEIANLNMTEFDMTPEQVKEVYYKYTLGMIKLLQSKAESLVGNTELLRDKQLSMSFKNISNEILSIEA